MHWSYSKDGYLFDKEAILQYIITKKNEYSRKMKEYERQRRAEEDEISMENSLKEQAKIKEFMNIEKNVVRPSTSTGK